MVMFEFSLNVFAEFSEQKNLQLKGLFEPVISCVRGQDVTTELARQG